MNTSNGIKHRRKTRSTLEQHLALGECFLRMRDELILIREFCQRHFTKGSLARTRLHRIDDDLATVRSALEILMGQDVPRETIFRLTNSPYFGPSPSREAFDTLALALKEETSNA